VHVSGCLLAGFQGAGLGVVGIHAVVGLTQRYHLGCWLTVQLTHADQQVQRRVRSKEAAALETVQQTRLY